MNDILDFSKIEQGILALEEIPFNLVKTVQTAINSSKTLLKPEVKLETEINISENERFIGDSHRLIQCLLNFLSNSAKFTEKGWVKYVNAVFCLFFLFLLFWLARVHFCRFVCRKTFDCRDRSRIEFEISDSGIGISEENLRKLFQPFTQADPSITRKYGGSGLGLTISKQIIKLMKGDIFITSKENVGTTVTFYIQLKLCSNLELRRGGSGSNIRNPWSNRNSTVVETPTSCVLVVDDNEINRLLISKLISKFNVMVDVAKDGLEAVKKCK